MAYDGIDLVIEGTAERVTDDATLQRIAKRYADEGWPARVENQAFTYDYSAPSAGPPPWYLYEVTPTTVYGVLASEPGGATRWRFDGSGVASADDVPFARDTLGRSAADPRMRCAAPAASRQHGEGARSCSGGPCTCSCTSRAAGRASSSRRPLGPVTMSPSNTEPPFASLIATLWGTASSRL